MSLSSAEMAPRPAGVPLPRFSVEAPKIHNTHDLGVPQGAEYLGQYAFSQQLPQVGGRSALHYEWPPPQLVSSDYTHYGDPQFLLNTSMGYDSRLHVGALQRAATSFNYTLPYHSRATQTLSTVQREGDLRHLLGLHEGPSRQSSTERFTDGRTSEAGRHCLPRMLAHPQDSVNLTSHQCFLRHQIEVFEATENDTTAHTRGRNKSVRLGQVGIRCHHCAHLPSAQRQKGSTYFPATMLGLYQAAQNMSSTHLQCGLCSEMNDRTRQEFVNLIPSKNNSSKGGRVYWAEHARLMGLVDTDQGIFLMGSRSQK
jgi:hypothetical protein